MSDRVAARLKEMRRDDADEYTPIHGYIPALIDALEISCEALKSISEWESHDPIIKSVLDEAKASIKQIEQRLGVTPTTPPKHEGGITK